MIWEDACRTLGVLDTATPAEIKEQYLYKVQLLHPDKTLDKPEKIRQKAEEELTRINEVYKFLLDDKNNPRNPPKLEIAPLAVRFSDVALNQKKATTIEIKSAGGPFTNCWIDNSPAPWLVVTGVKAITSEVLPLLVTIEAQGLPAIVRPERCVVSVRLKNEKTGLADEAIISVEIVPSYTATRIKVPRHKIKFKNVPLGTVRSCMLEIGCSGPDVLHGSVTTNASWLSASQSEIVLPKRAVSRCIISVDTDNLPANFHGIGVVKISTNGGDASIPIELTTTRQGQGYPAHSSRPGTQEQSQRAYGGMQVTTPAPQLARRAGGGFWFLRFVVIFVVTFGIGLACIVVFASNGPDGPEASSIWGWGAITFIAAFLISRIRM